MLDVITLQKILRTTELGEFVLNFNPLENKRNMPRLFAYCLCLSILFILSYRIRT